MRTLHRSVLTLVVLTGCASVFPLDPPIELFPGKYEGTTTIGANGCNLFGWEIGGINEATLRLEQEVDRVQLSFTGDIGQAVIDLYNTASLAGTARDTTLLLDVVGDMQFDFFNCAGVTFSGQLAGTLDGEVLTGRFVHRGVADESAGCVPYDGCENVSEFQVTRISP